jgi:2-keto-4-pentenoate hydratase/2-oxohepta-3-ene-1,7-dioic acid hydratase in catechol pathway
MTADEVPDPGNLQLRAGVNGELRRDSNTCDLIFGCREVVESSARRARWRLGI